MAQGAAQANAVLKSVGDQAKVTEDATKRIGTSLSGAFQSTGGTLQVAQGITQIGNAFQQLNFAAGGSGIARTLLEISKTAADYRALASGVSGVGGAFTALRAIMLAHPILTIASVLSLAASAMSLFSKNTEEATDAFSKFADTQNRLRVEGGVASAFGRDDILQEIEKRREKARFDAAVDIGLSGQPVQFDKLAEILGGSAAADARLRAVGFDRSRSFDPSKGFGAFVNPSIPSDTAINAIGFRPQRIVLPDEAINAAGFAITPLPGAERNGQPSLSTPFGPSLPPGFAETRATELNGSLLPNGGFRFNIDEQLAREQEDNARQLQQEFEELQRTARGVGETLGDGIADAILQARSLKDVINSLAQDLARTLIRQSVGNLATSLVSSFGQTAAQQSGPPGTAGSAGLTPGQG